MQTFPSRTFNQKIRHFDGGITYSITQTLVALGGVGAIAGLLKAAQPMIVQWLKNRAGRTIKVKHGTTTIEVGTVEQLETTLKALERHAASQSPSAGAAPELVGPEPPTLAHQAPKKRTPAKKVSKGGSSGVAVEKAPAKRKA